MREIRLIIAYFLLVVLLGATFAPWLYSLGMWAGETFKINYLLETPFQRYFNRAFLIAALALLWPLLRMLRIGGFADLQLTRNPRYWTDLGFGFLVAVLLLLPLWWAALSTGLYEFKSEPFRWSPIFKAIRTAVPVALLEEAFFRAGLMGLVMRSASPRVALWFTAAMYSIVHWITPPKVSPITEIHWFSGFELLPYCFWRFADPMLLLGGFLTLLVVGLVLGFARLRTRSIWLPIGLHAGWIFGIKASKPYLEGIRESLPWLGSELLIGVWPLLVVSATGVVVWFYLERTSGRLVRADRSGGSVRSS